LRDVLSVLLAIGVTTGLLYGLRPFAYRIGLLDSPGARKTHRGDVPIIGGLAMFIGFSISVLTLDVGLFELRPFFAASAILVLVGVLDDWHELSSRARFAAQIFAAILMVEWGRVVLVDLGALHSDGGLFTLGVFAVPFSVFCTVGVINALNMIDGVDGLAGGVALVALSALACLAHMGGQSVHRDVLIVLSLCVMCFVFVNSRTPWRSHASVFMGDAGSMFLGFSITWFFIDLSQGPERVMTPVTALWFLLVPLFDTVWLLFKRPLSGRWPTAASHDHIHHVLQQCGLQAGATAALLWLVAALAAAIGIMGTVFKISEASLFYGFLSLFALYAVVMALLLRKGFGSNRDASQVFDDDVSRTGGETLERRVGLGERRQVTARRERRANHDRRAADDRRNP
jgi:UDP-GlcNAc:undecaprenyl-phosphate GlcNAc-1-phosphate transferase